MAGFDIVYAVDRLSEAKAPARWSPGDADGFGDRPRDVVWRRETVHDTNLLKIEDSALPHARPLGRDCSTEDQFAFPYFGAFRWQVGSARRLIDATSVLRIRGGEEAFETHPIRGIGHASAVFTPSSALLDELRAAAKRKGGGTRGNVTSMNDRARLLVHHLVFQPATNPLGRDEAAIDLLTQAMGSTGDAAPRPSPLVERAKSILHDRFAEPVSLAAIASTLNVSPVYLTQVFRRQEGIPLYRYQTRLRLNRALLLLPECSSITELALDLGYSSHAHFTATFSATFGTTPARFRASRTGGRPLDWPAAA